MSDTGESWESERICLSLSQLQYVPISREDKQFLMDFGLPSRIVLFRSPWYALDFWHTLNQDLKSVASELNLSDVEISAGTKTQWVLGSTNFDGAAPGLICIEETTGHVIEVILEHELNVFWNSSIQQFSESFQAFESAFQGFQISPCDHDYSEYADVFVNKLLEIDPSALQNESGWTSVIRICHNQKI
jgi:SUKH-4 immunity protein